MIKDLDNITLPKDIVLPNHVALICDGNRRWARARGLPITEGHKRGGEVIREIARACRKFGIHTFTAWVFSDDNWSRAKKETSYLLNFMEKAIDGHIKEAKEGGVRIVHLGRKDRIPERLAQKITKAEEETKNNKNYVFNVALDYGGHDEIVRAAREIVEAGLPAQKITEDLFASYLDTGDQPYPYVDLLIRTSGEQRLSRFMPWQTDYAEAWWEESHLPDFTQERFFEILLDYSRRRRRFGGSDNVKKLSFRPHLVAKLELDWWRAKELKEKGEFHKAFVNYIKEQFGTSLSIAREASEIFLSALLRGETEGDWKGTKRILTRFYTFIKNNVKLAFEPSLVASLEIEYLKGNNGDKERKAELHEIIRNLYAELFRMSLLQANKIAHLRVLAHSQEDEANNSTGREKIDHQKKAQEYLVRSYEALKERVA